jgi:hypothetical protein
MIAASPKSHKEKIHTKAPFVRGAENFIQAWQARTRQIYLGSKLLPEGVYSYWCMSQNKIESIEEQEDSFKTRECSFAQGRFQNI